MPNPQPDVFIFGVPFWNPSYDEFHEWWTELVEAPERRNVLLGLSNPNTLNIGHDQPAYMDVLRRMDVHVNDGVGIRMASKMRGVELKYGFAGTDLMPRLFEEQRSDLTAFFFGAKEDVNAEAVRKISEAYPRIKIVGRINGYVDPVKEALPRIQDAGADLLMIAMGQPKQEFFMLEQKDNLNCKVAVTCGGMFDFFSGSKPRAPKLMRQLGAEWVYRLAIEPKRMFRRYVYGNPAFLMRAMRSVASDKALWEEWRASSGEGSSAIRSSIEPRS